MKNKIKESTSFLLDLDYTIFDTDNVDNKILPEISKNITMILSPKYTNDTISEIIKSGYTKPIDYVIQKYDIDKKSQKLISKYFNDLEIEIDAHIYPDYKYIKESEASKILVTTGIRKIQEAKIKALGIGSDFQEIIINDSFKSAKTKFQIFKCLKEKYQLDILNTYIIGDGASSEIDAGHRLGFKTIQMIRDHRTKRIDCADFQISSFYELDYILSL